MIDFFIRNTVAANMLLLAIVLAGLATLFLGKIPLEVFPQAESRTIVVSVPYRGATPEEVEQTVVIRIEEAVSEVQGIEEMFSSANASSGSVSLVVDEDYDVQQVRDEVQIAVESLNNFPPGDAESVTVRVSDTPRWVISVVLSGPLSETDLGRLGLQIRDEIVALPEISSAELQGVRAREVAIEIEPDQLIAYDITLTQVTQALRAGSIDVPAGVIETPAGEVTLRTTGRAYSEEAFRDLVIINDPEGGTVKLGDIATVVDGFNENPFFARFNGEPCVMIPVFREGNQSAIAVSERVKAYMDERQASLPEGVVLDYWADTSRIVKGRLATLMDSAWKSMLFVFIVLTLFLRPSLALWVVIGIPVSFLGTFALMPLLGLSINIVSLYGFILVLGVVVDDAIVTGENIYKRQGEMPDRLAATQKGTHEVTLPVVFGVLTTMIAFLPLYFLSGFHGAWLPQIATVVITVLAFSLVESKLILPAHLTFQPRQWARNACLFFFGGRVTAFARRGYYGFSRFQQRIAGSVQWFARTVYAPVLRFALTNRYVIVAAAFAILAITFGALKGGRIDQVSFPRVESERGTVKLTMQEGAPFATTEKHINFIESVVFDMKERYVGSDGISVIEDVFVSIGGQGVSSSRAANRMGQSHLGEVIFYMVPPENRQHEIGTRQLINELRETIEREGGIVGAKSLFFRAEIGRGRDPIVVQLNGADPETLGRAAEKVSEKLGTYDGLFDISDSRDESRDEVRLELSDEAKRLGFQTLDLARQVRQAFFGEEVQRIQRNRDEIRVMLRFPEDERKTLATLQDMRVTNGRGDSVPLAQVATLNFEKSLPRIERSNGTRSVKISADADKSKIDLPAIRADLSLWLEGELPRDQGVTFSFEGEAREQEESRQVQTYGFALILFAVYVMLAIPMKSYLQPIVVMSVIPFGFVGAIAGHLIEDWWKDDIGGMPISNMSYFGILALAGVVVNDSLVLVDYINRRRREEPGASVFALANEAGAARFRAVVLTSITTFAGLFPLIRMESTQAQFLIPMAVSLGYGIVFATLITLILVPVNYVILDDIKRLFSRAVQQGEGELAKGTRTA